MSISEWFPQFAVFWFVFCIAAGIITGLIEVYLKTKDDSPFYIDIEDEN